MYTNSNLAFVEDHPKYSRTTKKQRRREKRKAEQNNKKSGVTLNTVNPKTANQARTFSEYEKGNHLLLQGLAGTGKTFISCYLAMNEILNGYTEKQKLVIVRSVVPTRDMGFLPGNQKEKQKAYELPYYSIFSELFDRGDAYDLFKNKSMVEFISTSFVRGITLNNSIVLVDECQNLTFHELDSIVTRIGNNCRIIFSGDFRQSDLERQGDRQGILDFMRVLKTIKQFKTVNFVEEDIVRSELVKSYIIAKIDNGIFA